MVFILYLLLLFMAMTLYWFILAAVFTYDKIRTRNLMESIRTREDLEFAGFTNLLKLIAEMYRRKGFKVRITDKCGEEGNGLVLDDILFVGIWNRGVRHEVDCEAAMKLAKCMRTNSIYRGKLIALGDFKHNARAFCHKNVIECIDGEQLLAMLREVQKKKELYQPTS